MLSFLRGQFGFGPFTLAIVHCSDNICKCKCTPFLVTHFCVYVQSTVVTISAVYTHGHYVDEDLTITTRPIAEAIGACSALLSKASVEVSTSAEQSLSG
jgi:hypothetical protein